MLQSYLRAALIFRLSSTGWAFSINSPSFVNRNLGSIQNIGHLDAVTKTCLFAASDDDDFYADYDPSHYESVNNQSYDDYGYGQENRRGGRGGGRGGYRQGGRGGGYKRGGNFQYERDTSRDNSNIDETVIMDLLSQRSDAKRNRDFDTADAIRDDLLQNYSVGVDDRSRTWRTGCSPSGSGLRFGGGGRGRRRERDFGPNGHDYVQTQDSGSNKSSLSEGEIHALLAERLQAKMSRNFSVADSIQIDLINAGVFVHDGLKEWRADGTPYGDFGGGGRGPGRTRGSHNDRNRPYEKSVHSEEVEGTDDNTINKLVMERCKFKIQRNYDKADAIREGLREKFNIIIDDKLREWSVGGSFGAEHDKQREMAEQFANRGYIKSSRSLPANNETDEEIIENMVAERTIFKADRNYDEADAIRDDLFERFDVIINDKLKEWSIGGAFEGDSDKYRDYVKSHSSSSLEKDEEKIIRDALRERSKLKAKRDYESADAIRDELRKTYNVIVDDRKREWRVNDSYGVSEYNDNDEFDENFEEEMNKFEATLSKEIEDVLMENVAEEEEEEAEDRIDAEYEEEEGEEDEEYEYEYEEEEEEEDGIEAEYEEEGEEDEEYEYEEEEEEEENGIEAEYEEETEEEEGDEEYEYEYEEEDGAHAEYEEQEEEEEYEEEEGESTTLSQEELSSLTVAELKDKLRANGLTVSGRKAELVERLMAAV